MEDKKKAKDSGSSRICMNLDWLLVWEKKAVEEIMANQGNLIVLMLNFLSLIYAHIFRAKVLGCLQGTLEIQ